MKVQDKLVEAFNGKKVANICDCLEENLSIHNLKNINQGYLCGNAFTVKVAPGDNQGIYDAIERAKPQDVIIVSGEGALHRALVGEIMCRIAAKKGIQGFVIDGAVRDMESLEKMKDFTVFAKGINPNSPLRKRAGELNIPLSIGKTIINPKDLVIGDRDGLVIIRRKIAEKILNQVEERELREAALLQLIEENKYGRELFEKVKNLKHEYLKMGR